MLRIFLLTIVVIFVAGTTVVIFGPRIEVSTSVHPVNLPADLDKYLADEEKSVELTTPDVAKKIVWANPEKKVKTKLSLIYLHGFSATLMETHPLTENIAKKLNANVFYTRFAGHGQTKEKFAKATANQWLQDTLEAWEIGKSIGEKVIIIGTSTGATLATWLAMTQSVPELQALIYISPNFYPADDSARVLLWPYGVSIARLIIGDDYRHWEATNDEQAKYWLNTPALTTSAHLMALVEFVDSFNLNQMNTPILMMYSELDEVVKIPKIKEKFNQIGSERKKLVRVYNENNSSFHVLAGYIVGEHTTEFVEDSIMQFLIENNLNQ